MVGSHASRFCCQDYTFIRTMAFEVPPICLSRFLWRMPPHAIEIKSLKYSLHFHSLATRLETLECRVFRGSS